MNPNEIRHLQREPDASTQKAAGILAHSRRQAGIIIPFLALLVVALLTCLILAIDGSHYAAQDASLKSITDMTAFSALDAYTKNPPNPLASPVPFTEADRRQLANDAANHIAGQHNLPTASGNLGNIQHLSTPGDGELRFGTYYADRNSAQGSGGLCDLNHTVATEYPCWEENSDPSLPAGSVYVRMRSRANDPIRGFFSGQPLNIESESVATVVESCVVNALDVSESTTGLSHFGYQGYCVNRSGHSPSSEQCDQVVAVGHFFDDGNSLNGIRHPDYTYTTANNDNDDPALIPFPQTAGAISGDAYPMSQASRYMLDFEQIFPGAGGATGDFSTMVPCNNANAVKNQGPDAATWCGMHESRAEWLIEHSPVGVPAGVYFWTDYGWDPVANSVEARMVAGAVGTPKRALVNRFLVPRPLDVFLQTMNSNSRFLFNSGSNHSGLVIGFTGDLFERAFPKRFVSPPAPPGLDGDLALSVELGAIAQLTNLNFPGRVNSNGQEISAPIYPNYFDWGFLPDTTTPTNFRASSTDIVFALHEAQKALANTNQETNRCGNRAAKHINLMTDGIGSCTYFDPTTFAPGQTPTRSCDLSIYSSGWAHYVHSERMLMGEMADYLAAQQMPVNVFLSLRRNHYKNRRVPGSAAGCTSDDSDPNCFVTPYNAAQYGFGTLEVPANVTSPPPGAPLFDLDNCALNNTRADSLFDCRSIRLSPFAHVSDIAAFSAVNSGNQNFVFLRPLAALFQLSAKTGGVFCPLFPLDLSDPLFLTYYVDHDGDSAPGGGSCETQTDPALCCATAALAGNGTPCILRNSVRTDPVEFRPPILATEAGQAFACVTQALGISSIVMKKPVSIECLTC